MVSHADTDAFDAFYRSVRMPLLLQTWALTGDFGASQRAVRDTMVTAWHHWSKVRRAPDMEAWVRPRAWTSAMRRRHVLPFHKEQTRSAQTEETLAALALLSHPQRKVLLLAHLTTLDMTGIAREAGMEPLQAAAELAAAEVLYREHRGMDDIVESLVPMADELADVRWPRTSIITRAGAARRRLFTGVGAVVTVAALGVAGLLVTDSDGAQPRLDSLRLTTPGASEGPGQPPAYDLAPEALLTAAQVGQRVGAKWAETSTGGPAKVIPCQVDSTIDPDARAEVTRTFNTRTEPDRAAQLVEVSGSQMTAQTAYKRILAWVGACADERVQLDAAYRVDGVGNTAMLLQLTDWNSPERVRTVALARTGTITTAVATVRRRGTDQAPEQVAALLGDAVDQLCTLPDAGACTNTVRLTRVDPPPIGNNPGLLSTIDLPPVTSIDEPWAGTEPGEATFNAAATRCDQASFDRKDIAESLTQTFVIPTAEKLPAEFGLTQTVGRFDSAKKAESFVADIRKKMSTCSDRELGAEVAEVFNRTEPDEDSSVWHITVEISDAKSVLYFMSVVRTGKVVSQLGFVPADGVQMADGAFLTLTERSLKRLSYF